MSTKRLFVRENWGELTEQIESEQTLLWRIGVGTSVVVPAAALFLKGVPLSRVAASILTQAAPFCLLLAIVAWYVLRHRPGGLQLVFGVGLGSLSISVIAGYLTLGHLEGVLPASWYLPWVGLLGLGLFPLNWLLLETIASEHPREFRTVGFTLPASKWHFGYGALGGCVLAAHFFLTGHLSGLFAPGLKPWSTTLWPLFVTLGLRSLSEELFFRGLIFRQLYRLRRGGFWTASGVATFCTVLLYAGIGGQGDSPILMMMMITLFYVAALAMVNALLCHVSDSIAPGIVGSIIFHSLVILC